MKIVQSFWSKPYYSRNIFFNSAGGWSHRAFNYMSWAFSCLQLKKYYPEVELVTDDSGKKLLIDILELPYTSVSLELNVLQEKYDSIQNIWALGKIYAFSIQKEPFIHVDGDAYIWGKFPERIENADLTAQQKENDIVRFHQNNLKELFPHLRYVPECIKEYYRTTQDASQYNAGIIGGNDIGFFQEYTSYAKRLIDENSSCRDVNFTHKNTFPCFFEQYLFLCLAAQKGKKVELLIDVDDKKENYFEGLADFHRVHETKFIHLLAANKLRFMNGNILAHFLLSEYPDYYYRIIKLINEKVI